MEHPSLLAPSQVKLPLLKLEMPTWRWQRPRWESLVWADDSPERRDQPRRFRFRFGGNNDGGRRRSPRSVPLLSFRRRRQHGRGGGRVLDAPPAAVLSGPDGRRDRWPQPVRHVHRKQGGRRRPRLPFPAGTASRGHRYHGVVVVGNGGRNDVTTTAGSGQLWLFLRKRRRPRALVVCWRPRFPGQPPSFDGRRRRCWQTDAVGRKKQIRVKKKSPAYSRRSKLWVS